MNVVSPGDLKPCDVLLYNRHNVISDAMKLFDGSDYSHSGVYSDGSVLEAIAKGVMKNPLNVSVHDTVFIDVYRFEADDGGHIGDPGYPPQPVIDVINKYEAEGDRYAYESIILLAILTTTRKIHVPVVSWLLRNILENALSVLNKIAEAGKQPMICSELVFRCFHEALPERKYDLFIPGADSPKALRIDAGPENKMFLGSPGELEEINKLRNEFLSKLAASKGIEAKGMKMEGVMKSFAVPDFITPRDLTDSRNLKLVGRLKT